MSNYSTNDNSVRVDVFKPSGKWCTSIEMLDAKYTGCIHKSVKEAFKNNFGNGFKGMTAVCLETCHESSHPVMFVVE